MDQELEFAKDRAIDLHEFIDLQLAGQYDSLLRHDLFARFLSIAKSHHRAILILIDNEGVIASAFALWRPMVEAVFRGLFVGFCATEEQIVLITSGSEPYPHPFKEFAKFLDQTFRTEALFTEYADDTWRVLNGFTHGGLEQLSRRMDAEGTIGDHFDAEDILDLIKSSNSLLVETAIRFLEGMDRREAAQAIAKKYSELFRR
jgi:hypothetical protein